MKRIRQLLGGRIACAAAVLFCAAGLALPCVGAALADAQLFSAPSDRPAVSGAIGREGRTLPVAYELFRKRILSGNEITAQQENADPGEMAATLAEKTQMLAKAGVIPADVADRAVSRLSGAQTALTRSQDGVLEGVCQLWAQDRELWQLDWQCEMQWLRSNGLVTGYSAAAPGLQMDVRQSLDAYRAYLGLDGLGDWQEIETAAFSPDTAAVWSEEGQIYLYCSVYGGNLTLGAVSLPREALPVA